MVRIMTPMTTIAEGIRWWAMRPSVARSGSTRGIRVASTTASWMSQGR